MGVMKQETGEGWSMVLGDCCEATKEIPADSIHFSIHSPPFSNLYIYSDSDADMGNCADNKEFLQHYGFLIEELFRVMIPGRCVAVHCKDLPKYANRDDTAGLIDFPGMLIQEYEKAGFSFHSRVTIWKCPVLERERTNNNGLLHKTVCRDRSQVRQGMADYLLVFRKPPEGTLMSAQPISGTGFQRFVGFEETDPRTSSKHPSPFARKKHARDASIDIWRRYAEPVWWDIDQTDVLNFRLATEQNDERHICPLQLGLIERSIEIWSAPGDVVFSPFAGVGSEGVGAIRCGRKFFGIELKESYFNWACRFLTSEVEKAKVIQNDLFSGEEEPSIAS